MYTQSPLATPSFDSSLANRKIFGAAISAAQSRGRGQTEAVAVIKLADKPPYNGGFSVAVKRQDFYRKVTHKRPAENLHLRGFVRESGR